MRFCTSLHKMNDELAIYGTDLAHAFDEHELPVYSKSLN
jgi:hypothetical protein